MILRKSGTFLTILRNIPWLAYQYTLLLLILLLYPYNFESPESEKKNRVMRLQYSNGIDFRQYGMIKSQNPATGLYEALRDSRGFSLEVWMKSEKKRQYGPARIITFSKNRYLRNFSLGQEGSSLVFRLRTAETSLNGLPGLRVDGVIIPDKLQHILVTYDQRRTTVFLDSKQIWTSSFVKGSFANWATDYFLALGNELTGARPWEGVVFKAALYDKPLSSDEAKASFHAGWSPSLNEKYLTNAPLSLYYFDEDGNFFSNHNAAGPKLDLFAPPVLRRLDKIFLRAPFEDYILNYRNLKDLLVNILVFIPFGFLFCRQTAKSKRLDLKLALAILVGGFLFSSCVEMIQYYMPSRYSSCTDILNNFLGTAIGLGLYLIKPKRGLEVLPV